MGGETEDKVRGGAGTYWDGAVPPEPSGDVEPGDGELAEIEDEEPAGPDALADGLPAGDPAVTYLQEIRAYPLLTRDEEVRLAGRIRIGNLARELLDGPVSDDPDPVVLGELERSARSGERARDEMTEANLRLVVSVARRYAGYGLDLPDLIQEGNLGLMRAVGKYDHTRGFKFSTYATWWIRQAVVRAIADQGRTVRVPVHISEAIGKIVRASRDLRQELGREPSLDEIAGRTDMPAEKVRRIMRAAQDTVSLETLVGDGDSCLGDFVPDGRAGDPGEAAGLSLLRSQVAGVLRTLKPREERVLRLRFGLDDGRERTRAEIGRELGVTREYIRQIEETALRKLRHPTRSRKLKDFLD